MARVGSSRSGRIDSHIRRRYPECRFRCRILVGAAMTIDDAELNDLNQRVARGERAALDRLLDWYRPRLRAMLQIRMDPRLQGRLDASDVLQEAYFEVYSRLDEFARNPAVSFYLWLRHITGQRLAAAFRYHLDTQRRDARREIPLFDGKFPAASSSAVAAHLVGRHSSPSTPAIQAELKVQLENALDGLNEMDREIIVLRNFEELTNSEAAQLLDITPSAACNRYVRALERLRDVLDNIPGFAGELWK